MTKTESHENHLADQEMVDAFLLGGLADEQVTAFEARMQEDVQLALAVGARVESLAALEHAAYDIVHEQVSPQPVPVHHTSKLALLWLVATISLVVVGTWLMWPDNKSPQQSVANSDNESEQVIAQVADRWLAMIDEDGPIEVEPFDELEFLPVSMDDSWIGEIAAQTYRDSEA